MSNKHYSHFVATILKAPKAIMEQLTPEKINLLHAALGVGGEAGEIVDYVKKVAIHNHQLDREKLTKELGDLEYYLEALRQTIGVSREEVIAGNIAKLSSRYSGTYSDEASVARRDVNVD